MLLKIKSAPLNNGLIDRPIKPFIMAASVEAGRQGESSQSFSLHEKQWTVALGGQWCNYSSRIKDTGASLAHHQRKILCY